MTDARKRLSVMLEDADYKRLEKVAKTNDRSLMAEIRVAVRLYLNGKGKK